MDVKVEVAVGVAAEVAVEVAGVVGDAEELEAGDEVEEEDLKGYASILADIRRIANLETGG